MKQLGDRDKAPIKQVEVINVSMSGMTDESQLWIGNNMSEEYAQSKNARNEIHVGGHSKRKHQITYLAQQVMIKI